MVRRWEFGGFCVAIRSRAAAMIPSQQRKMQRQSQPGGQNQG
jgi:hypothetical protein